MAAALSKAEGRGVVGAGVDGADVGGADVVGGGGAEVVAGGGAVVGVGTRVDPVLVHAAVASRVRTAANGRVAAHMCPSCRV